MITHPPYAPYDFVRLADASRQIRVLDLAAPQQPYTNTEPLYGLLRVVDLTLAPKFAALSYVWGDAARASHSINCGNHQIALTENCFSALSHLRRKLGALTIWIDAICIDQADAIEKSTQISLMRQIYQNADIVYIWLGPGTDKTDRALTSLSDLGFVDDFLGTNSHISAGQLKLRVWAAYTKVYSARWQRNKQKHFGLTRRMRRAGALTTDFYELLETEWIQRIWTYQEYLFASNPIFVRGNHLVPMDIFAFNMFFLAWIHGDTSALAIKSQPWRRLALSRAVLKSSELSQLPSPMRADRLELIRQYQWFLIRIASVSNTISAITRAIRYFIVLSGIITVIVGLVKFGKRDPKYNYGIVFGFTELVAMICVFIGMSCAAEKNPITKHFGNFSMEAEMDIADGLIHALRTRQASDDKDYNHGVRGILQALKDDVLPVLEQETSLDEVDADIATHLLPLSKSAYPLLRAALTNSTGHQRRSWATSWAVKESEAHPWDKFIWHYDFHRSSISATPSSVPSWRFSAASPLILLTRAHEVGQVTSVHSMQLTSTSFRETERPIHLNNLHLVRKLFQSNGAMKALEKRAWLRSKPDRWTNLDRELQRMFSIRATSRNFVWDPATLFWQDLLYHSHETDEEMLKRLRTDRRRPRETGSGDEYSTYVPDNSDEARHVPAPFPALHSIHRAIAGDKIIVVKMKHGVDEERAGVALSTVQAGDRVFLAPGVPIPMILRGVGLERKDCQIEDATSLEENADISRLISPAAIMGMMQGQEWSDGTGSSLPYVGIV